MVIGICEDQKEDCCKIEKVCTEIIKHVQESFEIKTFYDGQEVLEYEDKLDLLFLDIEMPKVNGIQVKDYFQKLHKNTMILYVTIHDELMQSAFGMYVYGFIHKNSLEHNLKQILPSALEILQNYVMIDGNVDSRKVVYIKSERVYSRLILEDGSEKLVRISMGKLEDMLSPVGFIRTHKSYLVNQKQIVKADEKEMYTNMGRIPISIRLRTKVKKAYRNYCRKNAGYC